MEHTASSSPENKRYNDEVTLLDGLYEFHPDFFQQLEPRELQVLQAYYLTGKNVPENIFEYRAQVVKNNPDIESVANAAFVKLCQVASITR